MIVHTLTALKRAWRRGTVRSQAVTKNIVPHCTVASRGYCTYTNELLAQFFLLPPMLLLTPPSLRSKTYYDSRLFFFSLQRQFEAIIYRSAVVLEPIVVDWILLVYWISPRDFTSHDLFFAQHNKEERPCLTMSDSRCRYFFCSLSKSIHFER